MLEQLIIYACPSGELADQLDQYFAQSLKLCGRNAAHHYMPHCSLTGFFQDELTSIELYQQAIDQALKNQFSIAAKPVIQIQDMSFHDDWHGLELRSDWLRQLMAQVTEFAVSPTRLEPLRLKSWLHLSLAYEFQPEHTETLIYLAQTYVNPQASVVWEVRFYQRHADHQWTCHQTWSL